MDPKNTDRILLAVNESAGMVDGYQDLISNKTVGIRQSIRGSCVYLQDDLDLRITRCEVHLIRLSAILAQNAEFHILRAYHHASPSLWLFIQGILKVIGTILTAIQVVNSILHALTGYNIAMAIDKLFPGFEEWWNHLMNKISEFSAALGWGVDGVAHLLNAANAGADTWAIITGKERNTVKLEKALRTQKFLDSASNRLSAWQANPGQMIDTMVSNANLIGFMESSYDFSKFKTLVDKTAAMTTTLFYNAARITGEVSALRDGMPALIAKNIPQGIFDSIAVVDSAINDRILPAITTITDRIEELDAVIDSYQAKAAGIADKLLHPGDMLSEIDKLPDYARQNQLVKIDGVTSALMKESNDAAFAALQGDLTNFAKVAAALEAPPAPLAFMELELPGRSPGIKGEPRETWILTDGDY